MYPLLWPFAIFLQFLFYENLHSFYTHQFFWVHDEKLFFFRMHTFWSIYCHAVGSGFSPWEYSYSFLFSITIWPDRETCTARAAVLGQKNSQYYFKEKSIFMPSGRYLCIVCVKLRVKNQNSIDQINIVKRKLNFTISTTKNYFK
jgi:hypothetical protein